MVNKKSISITLDEEVIKKVEKEANKQKRSSSYIINECLIEIYGVKNDNR
jgi:predicted transcriptional regulator